MLQKILVMINAHEKTTAMDVACAIIVLDAKNFVSIGWNDESAETIQNHFFRGLTQFICMDDNLEITGKQTDKKLCANVVQSEDVDVTDVKEISKNPSPPSNKEVVNALNIICR